MLKVNLKYSSARRSIHFWITILSLFALIDFNSFGDLLPSLPFYIRFSGILFNKLQSLLLYLTLFLIPILCVILTHKENFKIQWNTKYSNKASILMLTYILSYITITFFDLFLIDIERSSLSVLDMVYTLPPRTEFAFTIIAYLFYLQRIYLYYMILTAAASFSNGKDIQHLKNTGKKIQQNCQKLSVENQIKSLITVHQIKHCIIVILIFLSIFTGFSLLTMYKGNSVLAEIYSVAHDLNSMDISKVIKQGELDSNISELKFICNELRQSSVISALRNLEKLQLQPPSAIEKEKNTYRWLANNIDLLLIKTMKLQTVSTNGKAINWDAKLSKIEMSEKKLTQALNKYQPIDWEGVAIRIAFVSLVIVAIRLLYLSYKQSSAELAKLRDQLIAIQLIQKYNTNELNEIGNLMSKVTTTFTNESSSDLPYETIAKILANGKNFSNPN